jgi:VIT1/CCC1 family predicted Fe2+/Mn2+ transporter
MRAILIAGIAGRVSGSLSMAAGEYVSVSSQSDTEKADLSLKRRELAQDTKAELAELAAIYVGRGLDQSLAATVAEQLTAKDAIAAHARDELGISAASTPRPIQAALASAASFAVGAALPLLIVVVAPATLVVTGVAAASLAFLALLGAVGAWAGGAPLVNASIRVAFWGSLAMALTAAIGAMAGRFV